MSVSFTIPPLLALFASLHFSPQYTYKIDCINRHSSSDSAERVNVDEPAGLNKSLIDSLLDWVELNTEYDVTQTRHDPPTVNSCTVGESIEYEGRQIIVDTTLNAAYDSQLRIIYMVGPCDLNSIRDQSILLHELVHDVQLLNRDWYCQQQPEWEAYKLQDAWLEEHGVDSGFDWLYIYLLSRCPRDHHP